MKEELWETDLFLLYELCIGAVVNNVLPEHRSGQDGINLLGADFSMFPV